jgi:hypothetical protein
MEIPNRSSVQTISPTLGEIRNDPLELLLLLLLELEEPLAAARISRFGIYLRT